MKNKFSLLFVLSNCILEKEILEVNYSVFACNEVVYLKEKR